MKSNSMKVEEALSFRLTNGMMLGQLAEEDWRREVERVTKELNELHFPNHSSATGTNHQHLQVRFDYAKSLLNALRTMVDQLPVQTQLTMNR